MTEPLQVQLRKGVLEMCVLALLARREHAFGVGMATAARITLRCDQHVRGRRVQRVAAERAAIRRRLGVLRPADRPPVGWLELGHAWMIAADGLPRLARRCVRRLTRCPRHPPRTASRSASCCPPRPAASRRSPRVSSVRHRNASAGSNRCDANTLASFSSALLLVPPA